MNGLQNTTMLKGLVKLWEFLLGYMQSSKISYLAFDGEKKSSPHLKIENY